MIIKLVSLTVNVGVLYYLYKTFYSKKEKVRKDENNLSERGNELINVVHNEKLVKSNPIWYKDIQYCEIKRKEERVEERLRRVSDVGNESKSDKWW